MLNFNYLAAKLPVMSHNNGLLTLRRHFETGITNDYAYRKQQLLSFKKAIIRHEKEIYAALYADLKKMPEECWFTENGLLLQEINYCLKHLKTWMQPEKVRTNLANFPSSSFIYPSPLGVVLVIGPWNFPLQLLLIPVVGAIAAGNCVVIKPSEHAPATASVVKKIIQAALPPELVMIVEGDGAVVIPQMMDDFRFDHIFYTGSGNVGKAIYQSAAAKLIPVTLELGGKDPCIVEADTNLVVAARRIVLGKFSNGGQMCVSPDYLLVHNQVKEKLLLLIKKYIVEFYGKDPSATDGYCKIINEKNFDRLSAYLRQGTIVHGGNTNRSQLYIEPTILENIPADAPIMKEEIFGPILPVIGFDTKEEAIAVIQRNPNPLSFYVFSSSQKKSEQWIARVQFGTACINNTALQFTNHHLPFGGIAQSGLGSYHGRKSFEVFTHYKSVMKTPVWFDPALKYPPLKGKLKLLKFLMK